MRIEGRRNTSRVWVNGRELLPYKSQTLHNHSPDGFSWGYRGSGPAQLALSLMLEAGVETKVAIRQYQAFKDDVIAQLPDDFLIDLTIASDGSWVVQTPRSDWAMPKDRSNG